MDSLLTALLSDAKQEALWVVLYALTGPKPFDGGTADSASALSLQIDFSIFLDFENRTLRLALLWLAEQARFEQHDAICRHFKEGIVTLVKAFSRRPSSAPEAKTQVEAVLEACHLFSTGAATSVYAVQEFSQLVSQIHGQWPGAANHIFPILKSFVQRLPLTQGIELWDVIHTLRATAGPSPCP